MNHGFFSQLPRPFAALAPMAGVTDAAFRTVIARHGKPDVMWTEFVPADGLCSAGRDNILHDLLKSDAEHPIVAQIYGASPAGIRGASRLIAGLGFDAVDLNMGCPARPVERKGGGACLIRNPALARQLIEAAREGAGGLPVTVKTRIGYSCDETDSWIAGLLEAGPAALTIHARTRNEMSRVPARWDSVARAVELARGLYSDPLQRPLIIGNGDVASLDELESAARLSGCDGVMVGRAVFGNPWFFNRRVDAAALPHALRLEALVEHTQHYRRLFEGVKPLDVMKKHYKAYVTGFRGATALRASLMDAAGYDEIIALASQAAKQRAASSHQA